MPTKELTITFTEQQIEILDKLREEGHFGSDYSQIVLAIFRDYMNREFPDGGDDD